MNKRLRVAMFTDSLEPSGTGRVMETLARHLPRDCYELFLICVEEESANALVERMQPYVSETRRHTVRADNDFRDMAALRRTLQEWQPDIFHNHIGATWEGSGGAVAARDADVRLNVSTEHLPCVLRAEQEIAHRRHWNALLDGIFAVSESVRQSHLEFQLIAPEKIVTVDNGVEPPVWTQSREAARKRLDLPLHRPLILYIGRLVEQKDPLTLLRALQVLKAEGSDCLTLFAGNGPMQEEVEAAIRDMGLGEHARCLGHCSEVSALFAAADVLAIPSRFEGLPLAALEAMAAGLPIVGCDACGVRETIQHGVNGWLLPVGDAHELARGLQKALHPETGRVWGENSRRRYAERFTAQHMGERQHAAYQRFLAQG